MFATGVEASSSSSSRSRKIKKIPSGSSRSKPKSGLQALLRYLDHSCYLEDFDCDFTRYRPTASLDELVTRTHFNKREVQRLYQGFKQECPSGILKRRDFRQMYQHYFPEGNASSYADILFDNIDRDKKGNVNFQEFLDLLSLLSRGAARDKLDWAFRLYDINGDGVITPSEVYSVVSAVYRMKPPVSVASPSPLPVLSSRAAAASTTSTSWEDAVDQHVEYIFQMVDTNADGVISYEEFMSAYFLDDNILTAVSTYFDSQIC